MMTIEAIDTLEGLQAIADEWDDLALTQSNRLPMSSWAWVSAYFEHLLPRGTRWLCLAAFDEHGLAGVWPLELSGPSPTAGSVLRAPTHPHLCAVDAVIRTGAEQPVLFEFLSSLKKILPGWREIEMPRMEQGTPATLLPTGYGRSAVVIRSKLGHASVVDTTGEFGILYDQLSRNFRKRLRKSQRRLDELDDAKTEFIATNTSSTEYFERFTAVEAAGWKGERGSAIGTDERLTNFYTTLIQRMAAREALEWHFLRAEGKTIAGHMAFRSGRSLCIWKIGYDEAYAHCSPGVVLMEETLRRACESSNTDEVNLVTGRDWHDNWLPNKRTYWDVWIYPYRVSSILTGVWPKQARIALRSIPGLKKALNRVRGEGDHSE